MLRVRLIAAASFAFAGITLAGCSSTSLPSWLQTKPPAPPTLALQFNSDPPGADVRTANGQTCKTPCTLALPMTPQSVSFALNGYLPQTVPVDVQQSTERLDDNSYPPPNFSPNPVEVTLQAAEAAPMVKPKPKPHKAAKTPKTAAKSAPPKSAAPAQDSAFPPPPPQGNSPYPPPPQPAQSGSPSPFPPPPSRQ